MGFRYISVESMELLGREIDRAVLMRERKLECESTSSTFEVISISLLMYPFKIYEYILHS